nr:hypothetical protein CFP56_70895 [Quercus suber]
MRSSVVVDRCGLVDRVWRCGFGFGVVVWVWFGVVVDRVWWCGFGSAWWLIECGGGVVVDRCRLVDRCGGGVVVDRLVDRCGGARWLIGADWLIECGGVGLGSAWWLIECGGGVVVDRCGGGVVIDRCGLVGLACFLLQLTLAENRASLGF